MNDPLIIQGHPENPAEPTLFQEMDAKSHCSKFTTISCRKPQAAKLEALITRLPYLNSEEAKDIDN